jgi:hypothetical protein
VIADELLVEGRVDRVRRLYDVIIDFGESIQVSHGDFHAFRPLEQLEYRSFLPETKYLYLGVWELLVYRVPCAESFPIFVGFREDNDVEIAADVCNHGLV